MNAVHVAPNGVPRAARIVESAAVSPQWRALVIAIVAVMTGAGLGLAQDPPYVPGQGDVLDVEVYAAGERQEAFSATVSPTGTITCPLIGEFALGNRPLPALAGKMGEAFAAGYYVHPQVLINVRQYAGKVSILGEVRHPGLYPVGGRLTLLGAVELAGGVTDFAAEHHVHVLRNQGGKPQRLEADLGRIRKGKTPDIALQRDDRIDVPRRWF